MRLFASSMLGGCALVSIFKVVSWCGLLRAGGLLGIIGVERTQADQASKHASQASKFQTQRSNPNLIRSPPITPPTQTGEEGGGPNQPASQPARRVGRGAAHFASSSPAPSDMPAGGGGGRGPYVVLGLVSALAAGAIGFVHYDQQKQRQVRGWG